MNYKDLLRQAKANMAAKNCITRVMPTQSIQVLHFQTCKFTEENYRIFREKGTAKTIYALDFVIKFKPENMHDHGNYAFIMFQGEKVFEAEKKHLFDFGFNKVKKDFVEAYNEIKAYQAAKKENVLRSVLGVSKNNG